MITLVIPVCNYKDGISATVSEVIEYRNSCFQDMEVIFVDDGSTDATLDVLKSYEKDGIKIITYADNRGKGGALKEGFLAASGDIVAFTDADLAYGLQPLKSFVEELENCHVAVGSRRKDKDIIKSYGKLRSFFSNIFSMIVELLLKINISDTQCGFKAYRGDVAKKLFSQLDIYGFAFDMEILAMARKEGYVISEIPIKLLKNENNSNVSLIKDGLKMLGQTFKIRKKRY